ncbi:ATP-binding protein [Colwellia sp. MEBiC06753]
MKSARDNQGISKVNLFSRYNIAVLLLFIFLIFVASAIGFYRYQIELQERFDSDIVELGQQANVINLSLEQSQQTLEGLKQFAEYYLANPGEIAAAAPLLAQDSEQFYLVANQTNNVRNSIRNRKRMRGNITGIGELSKFPDEMWQELAMANALTPAFIAGSNTNAHATWFYYLSLNRFISIYPWISRNAWRYTDHMLNESYLWQIRQDNLAGKTFVWSEPYQDAAGKGLKTSVGTGVFVGADFKGALVIDVDLLSLQAKLPDVSQENQGYALINNQGNVLVHQTLVENNLISQHRWREIVPESLQSFSVNQLRNFDKQMNYRGWLLQKYQLSANGWSLVKYQLFDDFTLQLKNRFLYSVLILFISLAAFLTLVFVMTRRTFINPASEFISHIEHCADGDPGKIKPTKEWSPWFRLVENIFGQNRSLLLQLKEQNVALDTRVAEKTQALIEQSEEQHKAYVLLRSVINAIPEFIIFNDNDHKLTGCNKSFEQFIQLSEAELIGTAVMERLPQPIQQTFEEFTALPEAATALGYQQMVETSGDTYEIFCTRFYNESGKSLGTIVILRDVSVQTAVQSALQSAKEQAEQANRAKSQFLANMSHEIRTPINAIQGMMALMAKTSLTAFQQQYLANAQSSSSALLHLIDELLDLSKIEAGKLRLNLGCASLDNIIDRVLQLNSVNAYKKGLVISVDLDANAPEIIVIDEMRLTQVLTNLINNAIKFTHEGQVALKVTATAKDGNNALLKFVVSDTGIGIAKDKQVSLFDAFSQADESMTREYGGSGLGLSISQQIVQLFGGEIKVSSTPEKGSEFSFVLPVSIESQPEKQPTDITLVFWGCDVSASFQAAIEQLGWQFHLVNDIEEYQALTLSNDVVLLLDGELLNAQPAHYLAQISQYHQLALVGICQPIMASIPEQVLQQLAQVNMPYALFDMPLYRYSLTKITKHLQQLSQDNHVVDTPTMPLPISSSKTKPSAPLANKLEGVSVLLVEDNLVNQMVAQELLFSMGAQVTIAENGQAALDLLPQSKIDIVLMDIQMPVMDGLTATRLIRAQEEFAHLPIIAMTAHARADDKKASIEAGMNLHVAKPVTAEVLLASIKKVLSEAETVD